MLVVAEEDRTRRKVEAMLMVTFGSVFTALRRSSVQASDPEKHDTSTC